MCLFGIYWDFFGEVILSIYMVFLWVIYKRGIGKRLFFWYFYYFFIKFLVEFLEIEIIVLKMVVNLGRDLIEKYWVDILVYVIIRENIE